MCFGEFYECSPGAKQQVMLWGANLCDITLHIYYLLHLLMSLCEYFQELLIVVYQKQPLLVNEWSLFCFVFYIKAVDSMAFQ